jgi:hypothetical protein
LHLVFVLLVYHRTDCSLLYRDVIIFVSYFLYPFAIPTQGTITHQWVV